MIDVLIGTDTFSVSQNKKGIFVNDLLFDGSVIRINEKKFKVFKKNKIFSIEIIERQGKKIQLIVDGQFFKISITDYTDKILDKLGIDIVSSNIVNDVKAPMPGSIFNLMVSKGDEITIGSPLLILEAMKMENIIKSPKNGIIEKVHVLEKENVKKNQILVSFK